MLYNCLYFHVFTVILLTLVVTFQFCTESDNKNFLKNKAALVFSCDYPEKVSWFIVILSVTVKNHNFSHTECHLSATQHLQQHNHHKTFSKNKGKNRKTFLNPIHCCQTNTHFFWTGRVWEGGKHCCTVCYERKKLSHVMSVNTDTLNILL